MCRVDEMLHSSEIVVEPQMKIDSINCGLTSLEFTYSPGKTMNFRPTFFKRTAHE